MPKKIAIIGPESTGKSTLTQELAQYFDEPFLPEYGRIYLQIHGPEYEYDDLRQIADEMIQLESQQIKNANKFLFCDTDLIMMKVWYLIRYKEVNEKLIKQLEENNYDYYFICYPDLPWEPDPLRENPEIRLELLEMYISEVENRNIPYTIIKGDKRLQQAVEAIKEYF